MLFVLSKYFYVKATILSCYDNCFNVPNSEHKIQEPWAWRNRVRIWYFIVIFASGKQTSWRLSPRHQSVTFTVWVYGDESIRAAATHRYQPPAKTAAKSSLPSVAGVPPRGAQLGTRARLFRDVALSYGNNAILCYCFWNDINRICPFCPSFHGFFPSLARIRIWFFQTNWTAWHVALAPLTQKHFYWLVLSNFIFFTKYDCCRHQSPSLVTRRHVASRDVRRVTVPSLYVTRPRSQWNTILTQSQHSK